MIRSKPYFILKIYILNNVNLTSQIKYIRYSETKRNLLEVVLTESLLTEWAHNLEFLDLFRYPNPIHLAWMGLEKVYHQE